MKKVKQIFNNHLLIEPISTKKTIGDTDFVGLTGEDKYKRGVVYKTDQSLSEYVDIGDVVIYDKHTSKEVYVEGKTLTVLHINGVLATVSNEES